MILNKYFILSTRPVSFANLSNLFYSTFFLKKRNTVNVFKLYLIVFLFAESDFYGNPGFPGYPGADYPFHHNGDMGFLPPGGPPDSMGPQGTQQTICHIKCRPRNY